MVVVDCNDLADCIFRELQERFDGEGFRVEQVGAERGVDFGIHKKVIVMGEIITLRRTTCPCGWKVPKKVSVELSGYCFNPVIRFECPICERRLEMDFKDKKIESIP